MVVNKAYISTLVKLQQDGRGNDQSVQPEPTPCRNGLQTLHPSAAGHLKRMLQYLIIVADIHTRSYPKSFIFQKGRKSSHTNTKTSA